MFEMPWIFNGKCLTVLQCVCDGVLW